MSKWGGKTRGGAFGYRFFISIIKYLGITVSYIFLRIIVVYFIPFSPKSTASTWRYARDILKYNRLKSAKLLLVNYYRLGQILIDKIAINSGATDKFKFEFEHFDEYLDVLHNSTNGVIMIGAHIGNWEIGTPFFKDYGKKIHIVMYDAEHEKVKQILAKNALNQNYKIIPVNEDNLTHVFLIRDALHRNEYVCFQGDRFVNQEKVLTAMFLGKEARFPAGPFLLASRLKVPIVFYFAMRDKKRTYRFSFHIAQPLTRAKDKKMEQALLEQYISVLENILKKYPEQWFNYYDFWAK